MKKVLLPTILLFTISSLLLLVQWGDYEGLSARMSSEKLSTSTEVDVSLHQKVLRVQYSFKDWSPGTYQVYVPEGVRSLTCNSGCLRKVENNIYEWKSTGDETLTYQFPSEQKSRWTEWTLKFKGEDGRVRPMYKVSLEDYVHMDNTWIGLTSKKSDIKKDFVRYYQFEPTNSVQFPLLLVKHSDKKVWDSGDWMVTYSSEAPISEKNKQLIRRLGQEYPSALVELDQDSVMYQGSYVAVQSLDQLESVMFEQQLKRMYPSSEGHWAIPVLTDLYFSNTTQEISKAQVMAKEIQNALSEEELVSLKRKLFQTNKETSVVNRTDQILSDLYGLSTHFFSLNGEARTVVPLFYEHSQPLELSGEVMEGNMIVLQGSDYLPLRPVIEKAGYSLTTFPKEQLYRVELDDRTYRFFLNRATFIMNEQEFGVASNLLQKVEGRVYMKRKFMRDLLDIRVFEKENSILLQKK